MENTRKTKIRIIVTSIIVLLLILTPTYFWVFRHDLYLRQLSRSLAAVNHPAVTKQVAFTNDLGLLIGNGDHCDYFVGELRSFENSSPKQIKAFYKDTKIWNPLNRRREIVSVAMIENEKVRSDDGIGEESKILKDYFESHIQQLQNHKLYLVYFLDVGNPVGCDIRCM